MEEFHMNNEKNRVLGRVLAVEETRHVSGAKQPPYLGTEPEGGTETSCIDDSTDSTCDQSIPGGESSAFYDSGTAEDTGVAMDCSTSRRDIAPEDPFCP
jgi:hypothetical protein